jgi:hypothetical protein
MDCGLAALSGVQAYPDRLLSEPALESLPNVLVFGCRALSDCGYTSAQRYFLPISHTFTTMHVTDLAINRTLGMQLAPASNGHILEMPESPLVLNHVGTVHASAQFALAEASSGEFLLRVLAGLATIRPDEVFAVLRTADVKFRKPAHGVLRASARFSDSITDSLLNELASRGRTLTSVFVEVADAQGVVTMTGQYDWFLQRQ